MNKEISSNQLISNIIAGIEKVKGTDITIMDLREVENTVCDYFILCPWHVEGEANAEWVLIDYVDVVVHIFQTKIREHYDLEGLWGDAKIINLETNY